MYGIDLYDWKLNSPIAICMLEKQRSQIFKPRSWRHQNKGDQWSGHSPKLKTRKDPGELLMWVHLERLKKIESDVHSDGSNDGWTYWGRLELARARCLFFLSTCLPPQLLAYCCQHSVWVFPLQLFSIHQSSLEMPSYRHPGMCFTNPLGIFQSSQVTIKINHHFDGYIWINDFENVFIGQPNEPPVSKGDSPLCNKK